MYAAMCNAVHPDDAKCSRKPNGLNFVGIIASIITKIRLTLSITSNSPPVIQATLRDHTISSLRANSKNVNSRVGVIGLVPFGHDILLLSHLPNMPSPLLAIVAAGIFGMTLYHCSTKGHRGVRVVFCELRELDQRVFSPPKQSRNMSSINQV